MPRVFDSNSLFRKWEELPSINRWFHSQSSIALFLLFCCAGSDARTETNTWHCCLLGYSFPVWSLLRSSWLASPKICTFEFGSKTSFQVLQSACLFVLSRSMCSLIFQEGPTYSFQRFIPCLDYLYSVCIRLCKGIFDIYFEQYSFCSQHCQNLLSMLPIILLPEYFLHQFNRVSYQTHSHTLQESTCIGTEVKLGDTSL